MLNRICMPLSTPQIAETMSAFADGRPKDRREKRERDERERDHRDKDRDRDRYAHVHAP